MRRISTLVAALATVFSVGTASATDILIDNFSLPVPGAIIADQDVGGATSSLTTLAVSAAAASRTIDHNLIAGINLANQSKAGFGGAPNFVSGRLNTSNDADFNSIVNVFWTLNSLAAVAGDAITIDIMSSDVGATGASNSISAFINGNIVDTLTYSSSVVGTQSFIIDAADVAALAAGGAILRFEFSGTNAWDSSFDNVRIVPEPTSLALVGLALIGAGVASRRRKA